MAKMKATLDGKLLHPSDYLSAVEFGGRDVTMTIRAVAVEDLIMEGGVRERKPVLTFVERPKKLVLNKTNAGTIASMYGCEARGWVGKKITMFPTKTKCGREQVDCIRIRDRVGGADTAAEMSRIPNATSPTVEFTEAEKEAIRFEELARSGSNK